MVRMPVLGMAVLVVTGVRLGYAELIRMRLAVGVPAIALVIPCLLWRVGRLRRGVIVVLCVRMLACRRASTALRCKTWPVPSAAAKSTLAWSPMTRSAR